MTSPMLKVKRPRCEYSVDPLGIDERLPRLGWELESEARGERQSAYRVLVARSEEDLESGANLLWDSGRVESDRSVGVEYEGERFVLEVLIPPNTTATVHVPSTDGVSEGGRPADEAGGIEVMRAGDGETVLSIGSGRYKFSGRMAQR